MTDREFIENYFNEMVEIINSVSKDDIGKIVNVLFNAWKSKNKIFIMGNGGSASTATHFAGDLNKSTIVKGMPRFKAISLVDNIVWSTALINDEGFENLFIEQLRNFFVPGDVVIAISVHGGHGSDKAGPWSQNLLKAVQYAKENGGKTVGFSGFDGGALKGTADVCVVVPFNSTPHVESFHLVFEHLIVNCLKEKIEHDKGVIS